MTVNCVICIVMEINCNLDMPIELKTICKKNDSCESVSRWFIVIFMFN